MKDLLLIFFYLLELFLPTSSYHASSQCVQLGQANANHGELDYFNSPYRTGPWTIGTRKFDTKYIFLDYAYSTPDYSITPSKKLCPYQLDSRPGYYPPSQFIEPCDDNDNLVRLATYAVYQNQHVMHGWLHFEMELMIPNDEILAIYVQVRDEYFNAIGEFVTDSEEQCPGVTPNLAQPSVYQILPCSAVGLREATISTAIFMAQPKVLRKPALGKPYLSNDSIAKGIHFTWRMSEYWCNRKLRIRPEAIILTNKATFKNGTGRPFLKTQKPFIIRKAAKYWLHHDFYGVADIKLPRTKLRCNQSVIDYKTGVMQRDDKGNLVAPWLLNRTTRSDLFNDYFDPRDGTKLPDAQRVGGWYYHYPKGQSKGLPTLKGCQVNPRDNDIQTGNQPITQNAPDTVTTFGGRCNDHFKKDAKHNNLHGCKLDQTAEEFQPVIAKYPGIIAYTDYIRILTLNRTKLCKIKCRVPDKGDLVAIRGFNDSSTEMETSRVTTIIRLNSGNRRKTKVERFYTGRKYHGSLCVVWTIFLLPVGLFCARYMKETCMRVDCMGAHFWFWVHVATSLLSLAMLVSSLVALWANIVIWGRSLHGAGAAHRAIGYSATTLFWLMVMMGCIRGIHVKHRLITMTIHAVVGFMIYFLNILAILTSCYIPGSPSMDDCDEEGNATRPSAVFIVVIVWVLIDSFVHIGMTVLQFLKDREIGVKRFWLCPVIPVLPLDSADDFIGSSLRKITGLIYAAAAFIMMNTVIALITNSRLSQECQERIGPSSCASVWGCSSAAEKVVSQYENL